jgi:hypothetical protein
MNRRTLVTAVAAALIGSAAAVTVTRALDAPPAAPTAAPARAPEGYTDTPMQPNGKWHVHDPARPLPPVVTPGKTFSLMAAPPSDAVVLFDGTDLSKWAGEKGAEPKWKVQDGYVETTHTGRIHTKDQFGDFQLHIEWATPAKVEGKGQGRGNNGLNIYGKYEIQILDSFENPTYADGGAAALYGQTPPLVNASRPPGEWQTYDVVFEGPRLDADKKLTRPASATVLHNGVVVHNKRELWGDTRYRGVGDYKGAKEKGPIELYEHGNAVRFRNIWIRPLGQYDAADAGKGAEAGKAAEAGKGDKP